MPQSDPTVFENILKWGWTIFAFFFLVQHKTNKDIHGRVSSIKDDLTETKIAAAKEFATKADHKDLITEIRRGFERIEQKLDGKADK
ncbi:hypothetical protein [Paremcibacter congregatus]|uniref:hypothetical protein n=1 Tax=Paremcibacter congregatus TaxID=2043170 RepID=UPI0030EF7B73|tara:strand:- start:315 stop:575 length:261 start_codon:yes stop_codon:yes gene_type:complete